MIIIIAIQVLFAGFNIWMAYYHAGLIKRHKPINHALWGGIYLVLSGLTIFVNWLLFVSLLLLRLPLFNTVLNKLRDKSFFYIGKESVIDRIIKRAYPEVFFSCIVFFIVIDVILFLK